MDYAKAVAEGRRLLTRSEADQWALARLAHQLVEEGPRGTLTRWAADLGVSQPHASMLRSVWARYGEHYVRNETTRSFNEYYVLARRSPDVANDLEREANERGRKVSTVDRDRERRRFREARDYLLDRRQRRRMLKDPKVHEVLEREFGGRTREREREAPPEERLAGRALQLQLVERLTAVGREFNLILDEMAGVRLMKDIRRSVDQGLDSLGDSMEWMRGYVRTGDRSFQDALDSVLADADVEVAQPDAEAPPPPVKKPRRRPALKTVTEEPEDTTDEAAITPPPAGTKKPRRKPDRQRPDKIERPRRGRRTA